MITLTPLRPRPSRPDDLSGDAHRQLIGWIGLLLPGVLVVLTRERDGIERWRGLESISHYYYTGAVAAFVGMLVALALFLFTYRGFANPNNTLDRGAAVVAGTTALLVAFFPTAAPTGVAALSWWTPLTGRVHVFSAAVLFAAFAFFALWLFPLSPTGRREIRGWRNKVYVLSGLTILVSIGWAFENGVTGRPIFLPESIALIAFSASWLVKGYADEMAVGTARWLLRRAARTHPSSGGTQSGR